MFPLNARRNRSLVTQRLDKFSRHGSRVRSVVAESYDSPRLDRGMLTPQPSRLEAQGFRPFNGILGNRSPLHPMMMLHVETATGLQLASDALMPVRHRQRNRVGSRSQAGHQECAVIQALHAAVTLPLPFGPGLVLFDRPSQNIEASV